MSNFDTLLAEAVSASVTNNMTITEAEDLLEGLTDIVMEQAEDGSGEFNHGFDPDIDQYQRFNQAYVPMSSDELDAMYNPDVSKDLNNDVAPVTEGQEDGSDEFTHGKFASTVIPVDEVIYEQNLFDEELDAVASEISMDDTEEDDEFFTEGVKTQ